MSVIYQTEASVIGGREGVARLTDSDLVIDLVAPGSDKVGNNPEQLFAMGYAACFDGALNLVRLLEKVKFKSETKVTVQLNKNGEADFAISANIHVIGSDTDLSADAFAKLVDKAHHVCPYSKAIKGNIKVNLSSAIS